MFRYNPKRKKGGVIADQILSGGRMLASGKLQDIHEQSTVQNYDIGTRLVMDDRVFRYCKAGTNLRELIGGLCGMSQIECNTHGTKALKGSSEVTILDTVARDKDHYAGGYYWGQIYAPETTGIGPLYRIKSSDKSVNSTSVKLTLETPLVIEIPASCWSTTWASIYGNIRTEILPKASLVCMPLIQVTAGNYFWGQTWGPCFMQCGPSSSTEYDRELYYRADYYGCIPGSLVVFESDVVPQRVGFLLPDTAEVGPDNFFMLQLSP